MRLGHTGMVDLEIVEEDEDVNMIKNLLTKHVEYTQSSVAKNILEHWADYQSKFVKIMPKDYKRVLAAIKKAEAEGTSVDDAVMEAAHG